MKAKQKPRQYALEDVQRLISDYRPTYLDKAGVVRHQREHTAARAWSEITKTRTPEVVARLEHNLVRLANVPYTLAPSKGVWWDWESPYARKRLAQMPEKLNWAAGQVNWVLDHPDIGIYMFKLLVKKRDRDAAQMYKCFEDMRQTPRLLMDIRDLVRSYNRGPHRMERLGDELALRRSVFLGCLKASGKLSLKQAALVLEPICKAIGMKKPTVETLKNHFKRHRRDWNYSGIQPIA